MSQKYWCLQRSELFDQLAPQDLQVIESRCRMRDFDKSRPIYLPADDAECIYLLASGLAKISYLTSEGKESTLSLVTPGELFGELAVIDEEDRGECVMAVEDCRVLMIPAIEMRRIMREHNDVTLSITKLIGIRRRKIERRLRNLLFLSYRERVVHLLVDLAEQLGVWTEGGILLQAKLSHHDLANLIGSTRETVTIVMGKLRNDGLIAGGRRQILLPSPHQLAHEVKRQIKQLASERYAATELSFSG